MSVRGLERGVAEVGVETRTLARCALVAAGGAVVLLLMALGGGGLLVLFSGLLGLVAAAVGLWWFLAHRGPVRFLGGALVVGAPVAVLVLYTVGGLWLYALPALGLWGVALFCARAALRRPGAERVREYPAVPPRRPVLIMNPKSGGGKVERFRLVEEAEKRGARVVLLDPSGSADVTALARRAVAEGADLLGVAGGDGTQALVAAVAAEHDLPFLVISAGTRNHFAMDLGLDRDDPARCLDALTDGVELRVDLGSVSGRPFVNTVSFGVYADVVQHPDYRDDKAGTALELLPDLLQGGAGDRLDALVDGAPLSGRQAILVSNNPYASPDPLSAAAGHRTRLDGGRLGVIGVRVDGAAQAAEMAVRGTQAAGLHVGTARRVEVLGSRTHEATGGFPGAAGFANPPGRPGGSGAGASSGLPGGRGTVGNGAAGGGDRRHSATLAVAVDGEALVLPTPVVCELRPGALRVLVPRDRPGVVPPRPPLDWRRIARLAFPDHHPSRSGA